jgi:protein-L-isoaspartate(D-aspartate) O-methyltransferase
MDAPPSFEDRREDMVNRQIQARGIQDHRVLQAMRLVPRHLFIPPELRQDAYQDHPVAIGFGQTISQPYMVALMTQLLHLVGTETVLEVGTGSGYQAAILAHLARQVHTIEFIPDLANHARQALAALGLDNVNVHTGDGSAGLSAFAPYQGIIVTAAAPQVPAPLLGQLADNGRLVAPTGGRYNHTLKVWWPSEKGFDHETITPVSFVPLRGNWGWQEDQL